MYKQLLEKIKQYESIIIARHIHPDGDACGSQFGLKQLINDNFPLKKVYAIGHNTDESLLQFFPENDEITSDIVSNSLLITVDTANTNRIDGMNDQQAKEIIKVDHHIEVDRYGSLQVVNEKASSTCEVITQFYLENKQELVLSKKAASYLYYGLITDTNRFMFSLHSSSVFDCARALLETGIEVDTIYRSIYLKNEKIIQLTKYIYEHYQKTSHGVAYYIVDQQQIEALNIKREEISDLIHVLSDVKEIPIYVAFTQDIANQNWKISMRSRDIPINKVANKYHGGGHQFACGAKINDRQEIENVLHDLNQLIISKGEEHEI